MRLSILERGHRLRERLILRVVKLVSREEPVDVMKTLMYRPEYFGRPFNEYVQSTLRGPSDWSVGERELFAAFVSRVNECRF
jgi:hypothetical protein